MFETLEGHAEGGGVHLLEADNPVRALGARAV